VQADGTEVCITGRLSTDWQRPWTETFDLAELGVPRDRLAEATACWVDPDGTRIPLRIGAFDSTGESALHYAAAFHLPTLRALLADGADPNIRNPNSGWTPLHYAACWGQREAEEVLLDYGANPRARGVAGRTPDDVRDEWIGLPRPAGTLPEPPTR
jgi:protein phosphatase 1 regulatory subunit 12A